MKKNDSVYRNVLKFCAIILIGGIIEFGIFTLCMNFRPDILFGVLLGCGFVCLNFFFLAFCVNKAAKKSESGAKAYMSSTYTIRMLLTCAMLVVAAKVDGIYFWAALIPVLFQRIAVFILSFMSKRSENS